MVILLAAFAFAPMTVSIGTLLPQMTGFEYLTRRPNPAFKMAQASSYDRASNPGPSQNWFANGDAGQFIRDEQHEGRTERVMADLKGPGAIVRVWSANPQGTIRFYFDGESEPRIEAKMRDLLDGKVKPFPSPFAYMASEGHNLYFPLPYRKSLLVTAEGSENLYYHVGYRTYEAGTQAQSYSLSEIEANKRLIAVTASRLSSPTVVEATATATTQKSVPPGKTLDVKAAFSGGEIRKLTVKVPFPLVRLPLNGWGDVRQPHNVLRRLLFIANFDGETTIRCPLGDFFCTAPGIHSLQTRPFSVSKDGTMTCYLPMPFRKKALIQIRNDNAFDVPVLVETAIAPRTFSSDSYTLHAQWTGEHVRTRPMHDMNLLKATGEGYWVGCNQMVANPVGGWWGEGDEKVYVDGETFPSTFGTGTEDFFGYAWSSPLPFERPYHAQPYAQGPGNYGYSMDCRFQPFDPIPFNRSLKFDLEMWHWADVVPTFVHTAYWYAKPGSSGPARIDDSLFALPKLEGPAPVAGAIEGEKLRVVSRTGGTLEVQEGFADLSSGKQLWWRDTNVGDRLVLKVPVEKAGRYQVLANCCHAGDYGIHHLILNGEDAGTFDFFGTGIEWHRVNLGTFDLPKGESTLEVQVLGANVKAIPSRMFGLDYLLLQKK